MATTISPEGEPVNGREPMSGANTREPPDGGHNYAISIKDSKVGAPYQRFCDLRTRAQLELQYVDLLERKARIDEELVAYQAAAGLSAAAAVDPLAKCSERYQNALGKLIAPEKILTADVSSIPGSRQRIMDVLGVCEGELRYLYNLYLSECITVDIDRIRNKLLG